MKTILHYIFVSAFLLTLSHIADGQEPTSLNKMVDDWAKSFIGKVPEGYTDTICLHLSDDDSYRFVVFSNGEHRIADGIITGPGVIVTADLETYRRVYTGDLSPLTAVGRSSIRDKTPLDFRLVNGMTMPAIDWEEMYFKLINFFNVDRNNKVLMGREHSRTVHGGNVVGLYYTVGYRSAYYNIMPGQTINEAGEKDPFHQSFIIISGSGYAKMGNDTIKVKANEAFYIKPGMEHKLWTDDPAGLALIWSAWGTTW